MEDSAMMGPVVLPRGSDSKDVRGKVILPEAIGHELEWKPKIPLSQFPKLWVTKYKNIIKSLNQDGVKCELQTMLLMMMPIKFQQKS